MTFSNVEQSCLLPAAAVAWRVSKADYNTDSAFTLHYYERRMKDAEQWSTGLMVRWSTGQLVCLAEPLNYVTLGKFINFLCRANRFAVISLSLNLYRLLQIRPLTCEGCGQFAWQPTRVRGERERPRSRGSYAKYKSAQSINVLGQRSMSAT